MRERASDLRFTSQTVVLKQPPMETLFDFQPIAATQECIHIGLTESGRLLRWNLNTGATEDLGALPPSHIDLRAKVSLTLSAEGKFAAIVNTLRQA